MLNEIIISHRIPKEAILSCDVNHLIRIADKKKWSEGLLFYLKDSHWDESPIKVVIVSAKKQIAKDIPEEVLRKCYYRNQKEFKTLWEEKWYQKWDANAWVIKFKLNEHPLLSNGKFSVCSGCKNGYECEPTTCKQLEEWVITNKV